MRFPYPPGGFFPATKFNNINLDWIFKVLKQLKTKIDNLESETESIKTDISNGVKPKLYFYDYTVRTSVSAGNEGGFYKTLPRGQRPISLLKFNCALGGGTLTLSRYNVYRDGNGMWNMSVVYRNATNVDFTNSDVFISIVAVDE